MVHNPPLEAGGEGRKGRGGGGGGREGRPQWRPYLPLHKQHSHFQPTKYLCESAGFPPPSPMPTVSGVIPGLKDFFWGKCPLLIDVTQCQMI